MTERFRLHYANHTLFAHSRPPRFEMAGKFTPTEEYLTSIKSAEEVLDQLESALDVLAVRHQLVRFEVGRRGGAAIETSVNSTPRTDGSTFYYGIYSVVGWTAQGACWALALNSHKASRSRIGDIKDLRGFAPRESSTTATVLQPAKRDPKLITIAEALSSAGLSSDDALDTLEALVANPEQLVALCEAVDYPTHYKLIKALE